MLLHWLSRHSEVVGAVWTDTVNWSKTLKGKLGFLGRRLRRRGIFGTINEMLFYSYFHRFIQPREEAKLQRTVIDPYWAEHGNARWQVPSITVSDLNTPEVWSFVEKLQPDLAFAMCINNYFGKKLRSLPRLGVFLWHEGITPEYKGLYSPFWAVHNLDFANVGYTLLRMNDSYDAGEVFVQGTVADVDFVRHHHTYIGHKAIVDSLPQVKNFLTALERGEAKPIERIGAKGKNYTYPGISDFICQRLRLRRHRVRSSP
jgi:hypothetical protein